MSLVGEVIASNEKQKARMVDKLIRLYGESLQGKQIGILGLAFKAETDDIRESPALVIIERLLEEGARVIAHDPQAMETAKAHFKDQIAYTDNLYQTMHESDALMILTEWNQYRSLDLAMAKKLMRGNCILDTRNLIDLAKAKEMGFVCEGVGRR